MGTSPADAADAILLTLENLFKLDKVTRLASVELWVLLTTVLLLLRFAFDFTGPWFGNPRRMFFVVTLEILNQNLVIYTMGLMQLSGARVNDYFQVWAVLLVTLQYSVKIGRPYTPSKQVPLLDLMSSLWSANLLRVQTFYLLRIPLWLIWSLNAVRIVSLFVTSGKGETNNQESMRLVCDYMSYENTLSSIPVPDDGQKESKFSMSGYKYLVHGEHRVLKQVQEDPTRSESSYKIRLDPYGAHKEQLVTVEKVWDDTSESGLLGGTADPGNHHKDLCLSFALYKLLRRRFYDLPMHELKRRQGKEKIRSLIFGYILRDYERAFRVTGVELSFLQDLFYSKHATMFAAGLRVPFWSLLLSLALATVTGYVRYIPGRMDPADRNRITHGVFITRLIVAIIVLKELLEIVLYVFSQWACVLMLCKYVQHQGLRRPAVESVMRLLLCFGSKAKWNHQMVRQQNLLVTFGLIKPGALPPLTMKTVYRRGVVLGTTGLKDYTKNALLNSLVNLKEKRLALDDYFSNAFKSNEKVLKLKWTCNLKVDTHIILVWHIATCLCEIHFFDEVKVLKAVRQPQPFMKEPNGTLPVATTDEQDESEESVWSDKYATAVSLSNYCVYLVMKALVPDNGLVAKKVLNEVIREIDYVITSKRKLLRSMKMEEVYTCLMETVDKPCNNRDHDQRGGPDVEAVAQEEGDHQVENEEDYEKLDIGCSLTRMGAVLGKKLTEVYHGDAAGLWRDLQSFWMGFLLHLAAHTRAATHAKHLAGDSELITHLWALLTHAGFCENHHEEAVDQDEIVPDINQEASR
uniref:DUF4220 domain-containing protein n=3 Tax=Setaria italica TaxID=4555 RepID=K3ZFK7_SETIT